MANFDGSLLPPDENRGNWGMLHRCYFSDAYRVAINLALDWAWFKSDPWQVEILNTLQDFVFTNKAASGHVLFPDGSIFEPNPLAPDRLKGSGPAVHGLKREYSDGPLSGCSGYAAQKR